MSQNWFKDMQALHQKFGVADWMQQKVVHNEIEMLRKYLAFRLLMCTEELSETFSAALVQDNPEEVVDGLVDLCVFAIGTLEVLGVDANAAWNAVHKANMAKIPGVKAGRPNPWGMPDLIKPEGWRGPSHAGNHGYLPGILREQKHEV